MYEERKRLDLEAVRHELAESEPPAGNGSPTEAIDEERLRAEREQHRARLGNE